MEFKSIDNLSITECCEQLNLRREDLPEALHNIIEPSERDQLLIEQLQSLLDDDKLAIESCRTIAQYEGYLSTWVDGLYHNRARTRIAQLKAEAEELAFYQNNKDSISGCKAYLSKYPKGKFVNDVESLLAQLKRTRKTRNIIIFIILLIVAGIFAYFNYVPVSYVDVDDNVELNNLGDEINFSIGTDAISSTISAIPSEDWIDCRVSGNTLYVSAKANPKGERSATITIKAHSSFFGNKLSDSKQTTITVSQETGYASHLSVSNDVIYLTANGGKSTVSINTDGIFSVSTAPASWITTSVNGKSLNLECSENSGIARNSYLIIKSGKKSLRLNITQAGKSATSLSVSTDNVSFSSGSGSRTITVSTDGEWGISTNTASWGHTSINGNTITLRVDANDGDSRTDYFVIKSGNIEKRINISQDGSLATYLSLSENSIEASRSGTGYGKCYAVDVYTDGDNVTATTSASWIDVDVVGGDRIEIETSKNTGSRRTATITVKADRQRKTIKVSQKGISNCTNCYNWQYGYSTGQVWGVIGYYYVGWTQFPQYGWVQCPVCGGSGKIED